RRRGGLEPLARSGPASQCRSGRRRRERRSAPLRLLRISLLTILPHDRILRLVAIPLALQHALLLHARITVPRVLSLIHRQRGGRETRTAVPPIPAATTLLPVMAPALAPARGSLGAPSYPGHRRLAIVSDGDAQDESRHVFRAHQSPGTVVPGARVPLIALVRPVQAVIEEQVHVASRGIVDRIIRHDHQL